MKDIWERLVVQAANQDIPQNINHTRNRPPPKINCIHLWSFCITKKTISLVSKHGRHLAENGCVSSAPGYPLKYWPHRGTAHPPNKQGVSFHTYRTITKLPYWIIFCLSGVVPYKHSLIWYIVDNIVQKVGVKIGSTHLAKTGQNQNISSQLVCTQLFLGQV